MGEAAFKLIVATSFGACPELGISRRPQLKRLAFLIFVLLATLRPVFGAKSIDLESATIADINAAFKAGTLTAGQLVQMCLDRIQSYGREGPSLHAVMAINPKAVEPAGALDAQLKAKGPRAPFHGIPV